MVYVCSDLHGHYDLYKKIIDNITADDTLYILGDLIDRGPDSVKLVLDIIDRPNVICCVGNHEVMMYSHYIKDYENDFWFSGSNGGRTTQSQLLVASEEERAAVKDYLFNNTYLQIEIDENGSKYLLSHSYFLQGTTIKNWKHLYCQKDHIDPYAINPVLNVVWKSPWRYDEHSSKYEYEDGRIHIIGHVPVQYARYEEARTIGMTSSESKELLKSCDILEPWTNKSIINIDGGCAYITKPNSPFTNTGAMLLNITESSGDKLSYKVFTY